MNQLNDTARAPFSLSDSDRQLALSIEAMRLRSQIERDLIERIASLSQCVAQWQSLAALDRLGGDVRKHFADMLTELAQRVEGRTQ